MGAGDLVLGPNIACHSCQDDQKSLIGIYFTVLLFY